MCAAPAAGAMDPGRAAARAGGSLGDDNTGLYYQFQQLCHAIDAEPSHSGKTRLVASFVDAFKGDVYLLFKLLLCKNDKRVYGIRDKQLVKIVSRYLSCPADDMISDLELGDLAGTCKKFFLQYKKPLPTRSTMTLAEIDAALGSLVGLTREEQRFDALEPVFDRFTADDVRFFARLLDHDLKINIGAKFALDALHPNAYEAFCKSNDLKAIICRWQNHELENELGKESTFATGLSLMTPIKPMLARSCKSFEDALKRCPQGMYAEIKYDGERIQIHKRGSTFNCYSRNLKDIMEWKVSAVKPFIPLATDADTAILDGEILLMDTKKRIPLPFGTLGVHKKKEFEDATVCVFLFDILYLNGEVLLEKPMDERRQILVENVKIIPNRIELSEKYDIDDAEDLETLMTRCIENNLEGLVLKPIKSPYEPATRHWLKMKKANLLVLGAYYGTGDKGGKLSVFLMGCYDRDSKTFKTVCKAGNGHDDATIDRLQTELPMKKIEKDFARVPSWLDVHRMHTPDAVIADPYKAPVWEIAGAQFSESKHHTANKISIRFPRVTRIRDDKDFDSHTQLDELIAIAKASAMQGPKGSPKASPMASPRGSPRELSPVIERKKPAATATSTATSTSTSTATTTSTSTTASASSSKLPTAITKDYSGLLQEFVGDIVALEAGNDLASKILLHCADDSGKWSARGLFGAISKKWTKPEEQFVENARCQVDSKLGDVQLIKVAKNADTGAKTFVATVIAQDSSLKGLPFNETAFEEAISRLAGYARKEKASVHVPRFSSAIPDMNWDAVQNILGKHLAAREIPVFVYTFRASRPTGHQHQKRPRDSDDSETRPPAKRPAVEAEMAPPPEPASNGADIDQESELNLHFEADDSMEVQQADTKPQATAASIDSDSESAGGSPLERVAVVFNGVAADAVAALSKKIKELGGSVKSSWATHGANKTTHLVCRPGYFGGQFQHVDMLGGLIVTTAWVDECYRKRQHVNEELFLHNPDYVPAASSASSPPPAAVTATSSASTSSVTSTSSSSSSTSTSTSTPMLSPLPSYFKGLHVVVHSSVKHAQMVRRYLIAYDATVHNVVDPDITNVIVADDAGFYKSNQHMGFRIVSSAWVWDSVNNKTKQPFSRYVPK